MKLRFLSKNLATRIVVPLVILSILGGAGIYAIVQRTIARFTERQIGQYLSSLAANAFTICDGSGDGVMSGPQPTDPVELRIRKAFTLGALETFYRQNGLLGFVSEGKENIFLNTELPREFQRILGGMGADRSVRMARYEGRRYAVTHVHYAPWGWNIVLAKERKAYASLVKDLRSLYLHIGYVLVLGLFGLLFVFEEAVRRPIRTIIDSVRRGGVPGRTGVAEFDYLSEQLQDSIRKRNSLVESLEKTHFLYAHDVHGSFTYLSPSITAILGYEPEEFRTHYSTYLTDHPANREVARHTTLSIQGRSQPPYEVEIFHRDGTRRWLEVTEVPVLDSTGSVVAVEGIARDITARKQARDEREQLISELQKAMAEIKTLRGIIPICSSCKKVRTDEGAWEQLEAYIRSRSEAQFSHGICPDCLDTMYPGFSERQKKDG